MKDVRAQIESLECRRLFASGVLLDPTLGVGGRASQPFPDGRLIGVQPDGKILITSVNPAHGGNLLMRLNADGSPDDTFVPRPGINFPSSSARINPLDGRIAYRLAKSTIDSVSEIHVLGADGAPDTSFDGDGIVDTGAFNFIDDFEWQGSKLL